MNTNENASLVEKYVVEKRYAARLCVTDDFKEAFNSFLEKRNPAYKVR